MHFCGPSNLSIKNNSNIKLLIKWSQIDCVTNAVIILESNEGKGFMKLAENVKKKVKKTAFTVFVYAKWNLYI